MPELQFKVRGYVEGCIRDTIAPRGGTILHMISRHFEFDRNKGTLLTSQSVFPTKLTGYFVKELQDFASLVMKSLHAIPCLKWPSKKMLGEFSFHKLRPARRLERGIVETKRSQGNS